VSPTGLLVGSAKIGQSCVEWQLQQRPDKLGTSDRFHKPARGIYMWWKGCNRLALSYLHQSAAVAAATREQGSSFPPSAMPSQDPARPAATPPAAGKPPATPPKPGAAPAPAAASAGPGAAGGGSGDADRVQRKPFKHWKLPHTVSCSTCTQDGTMLAFGMNDGTVIVWDDHFGER
jgi:hypothetical protein